MGGSNLQLASSASSSSSSTALGAGSSNQPWALTYRPEFTQAPQDMPTLAPSLAIADANEVVWLRRIQSLETEDLGLPKNAQLLAARFKAIMVLQAHELYDSRKAWHNQFMKTYTPILMRLVLTGFMNAIMDPQDIAGRVRLGHILSSQGQGTDSDLVKKIGAALGNTYIIEPIIQLLTLFTKLFLPIDLGINQAVIDSMKPAIARIFAVENAQGNTAKFESLYAQAVVTESLRQSIALQGDAFNHEKLAKDLAALPGSFNLSILCLTAGLLPAEITQMQKLNDDYHHFYKNFQDHCKDSVVNAQRVSPNFTAEQYSACYQNAFKALSKNPGLYLDNFLLELALQQKRKPAVKKELAQVFTDVYLPIANRYFTERQQGARSVEFYASVIQRLNPVPSSLEETVAQAHAILHADDQKLLASADAMNVWGGTSQSAGSSSNAIVVVPNASAAIVALASEPLFDPSVAIPGAITGQDADQVAIDLALDQKYRNLFRDFPRGFIMNPQHAEKRDHAVALFKQEAFKATTVAELQKLIEIAEPVINLHRNPIRDTLFSIKNTNTWKECFWLARNRGMQILTDAVVAKSPSVTETTLLNYRNSSNVFKEHVNNWRVAGAWGNTGAQRSIDTLVNRVKL